jgi:hypothetical protein
MSNKINKPRLYGIKLAFTRRVLLTVSIFFTWIMPLLYLYINIKSVTYGAVKVRFWVMLFMIIYLVVALKSLKKYISNIKSGILKRLYNSANILVFVGILYLLTSIISKAFIGVEKFFYYFTLFEIMGFICYNADSVLNDSWIIETEYKIKGFEQAKIEHYKDEYKALM